VRSGRPDGAGARRLVATILTCPGLHRTVLVVVSGVRACCLADAETSNSNSFRIHRSGAEGSRTSYPSAVQRRRHALLELSSACKTATKARVSFMTLFSSFHVIDSGCCAVAAQNGRRVSRLELLACSAAVRMVVS
jgi:hypothetical protein